MRLEDSSEKGPHVPPLVLVIQQNGLHLVLVIVRFVIWRVLNLSGLNFSALSLKLFPTLV